MNSGIWVEEDDLGSSVDDIVRTRVREGRRGSYTIHISDIIDGRALVSIEEGN